MKRLYQPAAASFLILVSALGAAPARAEGYAKQGPLVDTSGLPQVQYFRSRPRANVIDNSWIIHTQTIPNEQRANLEGASAPLQFSNNGRSGGAAGPTFTTNDPMVPGLNQLAPSGFQSNVPANGIHAGHPLAPGLTTAVGGHIGAVPLGSPAAGPAPVPGGRHASAPSRTPAQPAIATYPGAPVSVGTSHSSSATTSVIGTMKSIQKRLLDKQ